MSIKYLAAMFLLFTLAVFGQNDKIYLTNLDVFEEQVSNKFERFILSSGINFRDNSIIYVITSSKDPANPEEIPEEVKFLTNIVKKVSVQNGIRYSLSAGTHMYADSTVFKVYVKTNHIKTYYNGFKKNKFLGEKTINRNLKADIDVLMTNSDGSPFKEGTIVLDYKDEIPYDDYEKYESSQFEFTRAAVPKVGTFEDLFFPVLLVAASAAAILAFFIIRTK